MEVERICEVCIKPSSPTTPHFRTYKFSLLDQFLPPIYVPIILFYPYQDTNLANNFNNDAISKRSLMLKQSLSETLTCFYPLAGRIKDNLSIDCNDEGVHYVEARANISLRHYLNKPDLSSMHKLFPKHLPLEAAPGSGVGMVQETTFACGGISIGVSVSHMFMDGGAMCSFIKHWAAVASESSEANILAPNFDASSIFPQYDPFPAKINPFLRTGKIATRRLVFRESAVSGLKAKAISSGVESPTRVEVVSALLLKCIMAAFKARSGINKPTFMTQAVNLRRRAMPPFPECSIGNWIWSANIIAKPEETELASLVRALRESMRKIDSEFVKKMQGDGGYLKLSEGSKEMDDLIAENLASSSGMDSVFYSSWCNFGTSDINFGWGKPAWSSTCAILSDINSETLFINVVLLTDAIIDKGIEAMVFLSEEEFDVLEKDEELLAYASLNPSPLP